MVENKKPRICEVLGVEPMQEWQFEGEDYYYRILPDGTIQCNNTHGWGQSAFWKIVDAVNGKAKIINKPRWVKADVEDAKAALHFWPDVKVVQQMGDCSVMFHEDDGSYFRLSLKAFPSLKPGEKVDLDEILEAEK